MSQKLHLEKIKQLLNHSVNRLEQPVLARLRDAREQALARHEARSAAPAFAWATPSASQGHTAGPHRKSHYLAAAVLLAALLFSGAAYWRHATEHDHEASEVDVAILTDELPIEVYVD